MGFVTDLFGGDYADKAAQESSKGYAAAEEEYRLARKGFTPYTRAGENAADARFTVGASAPDGQSGRCERAQKQVEGDENGATASRVDALQRFFFQREELHQIGKEINKENEKAKSRIQVEQIADHPINELNKEFFKMGNPSSVASANSAIVIPDDGDEQVTIQVRVPYEAFRLYREGTYNICILPKNQRHLRQYSKAVRKYLSVQQTRHSTFFIRSFNFQLSTSYQICIRPFYQLTKNNRLF